MLTRIRRTIRHIRYYSAPRERTVWSRLWDWVAMACIALAPIAAFAADAMVNSIELVQQSPGRMSRQADGRLQAVMVGDDTERIRGAAPLDGEPFGSFSVIVQRERRGWPLTTSIGELPARANLDLNSDRLPRENVLVPRDDPAWAAIDAALERHGVSTLLNAWRRQSVERDHHGWAWLFASVVWLALLLIAARFTMFFAWFMTGLITDRAGRIARMRAKKGLCENCGYDLRGLEWAERCPECGEVT